MSGLKRNIPVPESMPLGYKLLLQKEKMVKPASVKFRNEIIQAQNRKNYIAEYDRIQGILSGYADRFARPGGGHEKHKLINRQNDLKKLFKLSHHAEDHEIHGKPVENKRRPFSSVPSESSSKRSITFSEIRRI